MKNPSILISGKFVWDLMVQREYPNGPQDQKTFVDHIVSNEPGGTAGNVACMMAYYGWQTYPQAQLDLSRYGWALARGLKAWGCNMDFVENTQKGKTTIYHEERKLDKKGNRAGTHYDRGGWGSKFGAHKYLRAKDEAPALIDKLGFVPDVYFFDAAEAGHETIANALKQKGTLIYFEPEELKGNADAIKKIKKRIPCCSVMHFSRQTFSDVSFCDEYKDKLFIQTCDCEGVRFKLREGEWQTVPTARNENEVDHNGAGDTLTAVFLNALAEMDVLSLDKMTEDIVRKALEKAVKVSSESVSYQGAKGIYWKALGDKAEAYRVEPRFDLLGEGLGKEYKGKILYMHGSSSCGNSTTPGFLANALPEYEIIAPDTPHDPYEAIGYFKQLCSEIKPDLIIGSSMGGFYAQKMTGWKRICSNPALHMSNDEDITIGKHSYRQTVDRIDGSRNYIITQEIQDHFREIEAQQLENIPESDKELCWGIFADHDTIVTDSSRKEFCSIYPHTLEYHGEHRLSEEVVEKVVAPLVRDILK